MNVIETRRALELDLAPEAERPGFSDGFMAPMKGVSYIFRRPNLWPLAAVPFACFSLVSATLAALSIAFLPRLANWLVGPASTWYASAGSTLLAIGLAVAGALISCAIGLVFAQPLSGPALERLTRHFEDDIGASARPVVPFWRQAARSVGGMLVGWAVCVPLLVLLTLVTFFLPVLVWLTLPLKVTVFGMMVTWDLMDYPFTVRGWTVDRRVRWMYANLRAVIGFGFSLGLVMLVPCVQVLLLPAGAVGATWLYFRTQRS